MSEDPAPARPEFVVAPSAEPTNPGAPPVAAPPVATPERREASPNKLHEWGAAILIMIVLTAFLVFITRFIRGTSL